MATRAILKPKQCREGRQLFQLQSRGCCRPDASSLYRTTFQCRMSFKVSCILLDIGCGRANARTATSSKLLSDRLVTMPEMDVLEDTLGSDVSGALALKTPRCPAMQTSLHEFRRTRTSKHAKQIRTLACPLYVCICSNLGAALFVQFT